jgi:alpha-1,3-rhamnosyl/mannosyltransferase
VRVAVDARSLASGRGVARYLRGMLGALDALGGLELVPYAPRPRARRPVYAAAALAGRPRLDALAGGADAVWLPAPAPVAASRGVRLVLTVHDLSWRHRPGDFTAYERAWHGLTRFRALLRRADAVVADTAVVAAELRALGARAVRVVPPGVTALPAGGALPAGLPDRFVLFAGALEPRKDPGLLDRAAARAGVPAVFAGTGRLAPGLRGHVLGRVDDATLGALYARAAALVLPSRLEGFGFPPLEAALAGTPAIVTDLPVFRETLGDDGAVFVPAGDEAALAAAIAAVDDRTVPAARARARALTWARAAAGLREVLVG